MFVGDFLSVLGLADDFRTLKWEEVFGYPEGALKQMRKLLVIAT